MKNYTVAPGDTLFGIAAREYGDGESFAGLVARWYGDEHLAIVIAFANDMDPATELTSGTVLIQPGLHFRLHVAGHTLRPHKLFSAQTVHFPR